MITYLYKTMSLGNLQRARTGGQVATILLFIMVVVLVFILVTANIGQLSVTTTNLANAADSASLYLASQLATRSRALVQVLGGTKSGAEKCHRRGLSGIFGGGIGAVASIVLVIITGRLSLSLTSFMTTAASHMGAATVGGAIGGAIGGAMAGPAVTQGALQGVETGFAIGRAIKRAADITRDIAKTIK